MKWLNTHFGSKCRLKLLMLKAEAMSKVLIQYIVGLCDVQLLMNHQPVEPHRAQTHSAGL